jgi:hypothetical protein
MKRNSYNKMQTNHRIIILFIYLHQRKLLELNTIALSEHKKTLQITKMIAEMLLKDPLVVIIKSIINVTLYLLISKKG